VITIRNNQIIISGQAMWIKRVQKPGKSAEVVCFGWMYSTELRRKTISIEETKKKQRNTLHSEYFWKCFLQCTPSGHFCRPLGFCHPWINPECPDAYYATDYNIWRWAANSYCRHCLPVIKENSALHFSLKTKSQSYQIFAKE